MAMKKLMAMMLAATMTFGGTSVTAFAASGESETQTETTAVSGETTETKKQTEAEKKESESEAITETEVQEKINVTESEDGTVTFSFGDWEWSMEDNETKEKTKTGTVTNVNSYLHLRNGAGMSYDIIGHLLPGAEVEVVGEDGDWYEVVVPEQKGYVHSDYLSVIESAASSKDVDEDMLKTLLYMMMLSTNGSEGGVELTPDGNLTLVDDIGSSTGEGQQFLTFVTKSGNTFYMIIDRNDKGEENVHFLNLVDEADLLALMDEETAAQLQTDTTVTEPVVEEKTTEADETEPIEETETTKSKSPIAALLVLFLVGVGGVGGFLYFKMNGKKKPTSDAPDPDADYQDEEEEIYDLPDDDEDESDEEDEYAEEEETME